MFIRRRNFIMGGAAAVAAASISRPTSAAPTFRLGGPIPKTEFTDPASWVAALKSRGYRAAYCPLSPEASDAEVKAYADAAKQEDIVIAEVGAFGVNPISPNDAERKKAIDTCAAKLALADRIGARCCVNVSGSRGERWAGPHKDNLTAFDITVESVRAIVDAVKSTRSWYTLELMPWALPDSVESYVKLIKAIDRKGFAVHFDPVNIVCSPQRYYANAAMIRDGFRQLGPCMKSIHAKDILLQDSLTTHLDEVLLGTGNLDYAALLTELKQYPDVPVMLEHLKTQELYKQAADHIRSVASGLGLSFG